MSKANQVPADDKEEHGGAVQEISEQWNTLDESIFTKALNQQINLLERTADGLTKDIVCDTKLKQVKQASTSTPSKLNSNPPTQSNKTKYKLSHQSRKCKFDAVKQTNTPAGSLDNSVSRVHSLEQKNKKCSPTDTAHLKQPCIVPPILDPSSLPQLDTEDKALASMLMAWYMAGYHTGHYDAMKRKEAN